VTEPNASRETPLVRTDQPQNFPAMPHLPLSRTRSTSWPGALVLLTLLTLLCGPVLAATIQVSPDRNPVRLDETFNLVFSAEGSPDDEPDFRPLQESFEILSQSQGSQMSIVNGRFSRKTEWTLTVTAKRAGTLTIPAIAFGRDRSAPASITVEDAPAASSSGGDRTAGEDVMLEVEVEPRDPYVQAQVRYTARVLLRVDLAGADLGEPNPPDALIQRLGEDKRYTTTRDGLQYTVIERKYALFPQKSGAVRIEPLHLEARIAAAGRSRFNSFFNRPTRIARFESEAVELAVRPAPASFPDKHWLPAEQVRLEENWSQDPTQLKAGEPVTRTLTVKADGATVGVLPELGVAPEDAALKHYPDQPALNEDKTPGGVNASRQEKIALIPGKPGRYRLPAIEIPWWNTRDDRLEFARLPARVLTVAAGASQAPAESPPASAPTPTAESEPAPATVSPAIPSPASSDAAWANVWFWLAVFCALGWSVTLLIWWVSRRAQRVALAPASAEPSERLARDERTAFQTLQRACAANDAVRARQALLDWARVRWPERAPVTLAVWAELGEAFRAEIEALERALYGNAGYAWNGEGLGRLCAELRLARGARKEKRAAALAPLYKTGTVPSMSGHRGSS
jgi:hypothetical protein